MVDGPHHPNRARLFVCGVLMCLFCCGCVKDSVLVIEIKPQVNRSSPKQRRAAQRASHVRLKGALERARTCAVELDQAWLSDDVLPTGLSDELVRAVLARHQSDGEMMWFYREPVRLVMRVEKIWAREQIDQELSSSSHASWTFELQLSPVYDLDRFKLNALYALADNSLEFTPITLHHVKGLCRGHGLYKLGQRPSEDDVVGADLACCQLQLGQLVLVEGILNVANLRQVSRRSLFMSLQAEQWRPYSWGVTSAPSSSPATPSAPFIF